MSKQTQIIFLFCLFVCACSKRQTIDPQPFDDSQLEYFPLEPGRYLVYQVDSLVYDPAAGGVSLIDSSSTLVKELVGDTLLDNNGQIQYLIERYERQGSALPWKLTSIGTASRNMGQAVWTAQNLKFLKMIFPMDQRSAWDGNLWIDEYREIEVAGERIQPFINWAYEVDSIDVPAVIGDFSFDSTLIITEVNYTNVVERRFSRSWYAKHIGLVQKEQWILDSQYCNQFPIPADCTTLPWTEKAEKGYILRQVILEFN